MQRSNTPPPDVKAVRITEKRLTFDLEDGRVISMPLACYPTLMLATPQERAQFEVCHSSVHWPKLDCDISSDGLLRGAAEARKYAERAWRRKGRSATRPLPEPVGKA
jgi:hypothetical protein